MPTNHPPRALILADGSRAEMRDAVQRLRPTIERHLSVVGVSLDFADELDTTDADIAIVLGGDGSILRAAHQMAYQQRPVLGVNLGRLGFLAALQPEQLEQALPEIAAGRHAVIEHLMIECTVTRSGNGDSPAMQIPQKGGQSPFAPKTPQKGIVPVAGQPLYHALGLNEAAVLAGPPFTMVDIQLYVDGELVTTYSCDGLVVSTPVGSTAHSLSAGGPILRNDLQALVVLPISPHTLTHRPVVESADRTIELAVPEPHEGTSLVVDGRVLGTLQAGDRVRIQRSQARFQMIQVEGQSYYRTLHDKLGWSGQIRLNQ